MKLFSALTVALAGASLSSALSLPHEVKDLTIRDEIPSFFNAPVESLNELHKRKGGGGRGGGGGGSSSSSGSSGGSRSGGSSSGGSSGGGSRGIAPTYGGGRFYGGGATSAYSAGGRSPRGINPIFIATPLLLFPGFTYGAYRYRRDGNTYTFLNKTLDPPRNQTRPVECLCAKGADCGCDDNTDKSYLDSLIGNGSYAALNQTLVNVARDDGKDTIIINGTLPSGTAAAQSSSAVPQLALGWAGYCVMVLTVMVAAFGL